MTQPALFDLPPSPADTSDRGERNKRPRYRPLDGDGPDRITYVRRPGSARGLCADCIADILARGADVAPYPMPGRWRRQVNGKRERLVCDPHKQDRIRRDGGRL